MEVYHCVSDVILPFVAHMHHLHWEIRATQLQRMWVTDREPAENPWGVLSYMRRCYCDGNQACNRRGLEIAHLNKVRLLVTFSLVASYTMSYADGFENLCFVVFLNTLSRIMIVVFYLKNSEICSERPISNNSALVIIMIDVEDITWTNHGIIFNLMHIDPSISLSPNGSMLLINIYSSGLRHR